jgi:hypothetical protein
MKQIKNLLKVQQQLAAPKNQTNKFGGYQYRSAEGILEKLKPLLFENNLQLTITSRVTDGADDRVQQRENGASSSMTSVPRVVVTGVLLDEDGVELSCDSSAFVDLLKKGMDFAQATGAAESYAKKYMLGNMFLIDDSSLDPDATNDHGRKAPARPKTYRK